MPGWRLQTDLEQVERLMAAAEDGAHPAPTPSQLESLTVKSPHCVSVYPECKQCSFLIDSLAESFQHCRSMIYLCQAGVLQTDQEQVGGHDCYSRPVDMSYVEQPCADSTLTPTFTKTF